MYRRAYRYAPRSLASINNNLPPHYSHLLYLSIARSDLIEEPYRTFLDERLTSSHPQFLCVGVVYRRRKSFDYLHLVRAAGLCRPLD